MGCGVCAAGVDRVVVHNKIEHEKLLLRTVVLIKVLGELRMFVQIGSKSWSLRRGFLSS
jgi:hypothetical protein